MTGRVIDSRYEVLERVGEGALFQVSKARDATTGRVVAIKTLRPPAAEAASVPALLRQVAPALLNLNHANIARVEGVGEESGLPYLVTEFVRGINLKERIRRIAPFTLSVAVDFSIAIGEALAQAHAEGQVHGDLRPQNVIVSPEGAVKVSDFGMHSVIAASQDALASNLHRAVHYQAPEVVAGSTPSPSSDIYSLGAILYEMLTGSLPYPADNPMMVAVKQQSEPVPSPRTLNPGVPRSIEGTVMKALFKRPEERYKTVGDMLNDLKSVRDALRFGKPLSWSPLENTGSDASGALRIPIAEPAAAGAARMSATSTADDKISPFLKLALGTLVVIFLFVTIAGVAVWMATFARPPDAAFPRLVGMKIDQARTEAAKASLRLMEHEEFSDKHDAGVVYKVDPDLTGRSVPPGRSINIWVSKGSHWVYVPDVTKRFKDDAEKALKEAGLTLGQVDRQYDAKTEFDYVITQNPKDRKRVLRDTPINLAISDGPTPNVENPPDASSGGAGSGAAIDTGETQIGTSVDEGANPRPANEPGADTLPRTVNLSKKIPRDGRGSRRVRIEFDDATGPKTALDEYHDEGETVQTRVTVIGRRLTVRVYYGDDPEPVSRQTKMLTENP